MFSSSNLLIGGIAAIIISSVGSILNGITLYVLLSNRKIRRNPTTVLIIFLTVSNLFYTAIALPLTGASMLHAGSVARINIRVFISLLRFFKQHPLLCQLLSFFFYWSFAALLFIEVALAVNRWAVVCQNSVRYKLVFHQCSLISSFQVFQGHIWSMVNDLKDISMYFFRFSSSTSLVAGCVCWFCALIIVLIPTAISGWGQFGWDPGSGRMTLIVCLLFIDMCLLLIFLSNWKWQHVPHKTNKTTEDELQDLHFSSLWIIFCLRVIFK